MLFFTIAIANGSSFPKYVQENMVFRGYGEARYTHSNIGGTQWQSVQRIRPTMKWFLHDRFTLVITPEAMLTQGRYEFGEFLNLLETPIAENLPVTLDEVIAECEWNLERERTIDEVNDVLALPRLFVDVNLPFADFRIGRQTVNWGSSLYFNPTDVLVENLLASPWQERIGVNAIRTTVPIGQEAQFLSIVASDDEFENWKTAIKGGSNIGSTDLYGVGYLDKNDALIGIDIKGDAIIGFWTEAAYRFPISEINDGDIKISVGTDYSFPILDQMIVLGQITYDSSGEKDPKYYDWGARQSPDFAFPACETYDGIIPDPPEEYRQTLGRWYGLMSVSTTWESQWKINTAALFNLNDGTGLIFPSLQALLGSRWQLNIGGQFFVGEDGEFRPKAIDTIGVNPSELIPTRTMLTWVRWNL